MMMTFTFLRVRAFWYIREYISWQTNLYVLRKTSELKSKCFKSCVEELNATHKGKANERNKT